MQYPALANPPATPLATAEAQRASAARPPTVPATWPTRVLVASHGGPSADAAVRIAHTLARRTSARLDVVTIHAPRVPAPVGPERRGLERCEAQERGQAAGLLRAVRARHGRAPDSGKPWPVELEVGDPAGVIVRLARERTADLVVLGIGREDPAARRVGGRTSVFVARDVDVPTYVAAEGDLARRCVAVLPAGRDEAPLLRTLVGCVADGADIWLVRCEGARQLRDGAEARSVIARACGADSLQRLGTIDVVNIDGDREPLTGVLQVADSVRADLVAVSVPGLPGRVRVFLPNLAEPLLLAARCSILVVPDPSLLVAAKADGPTSRSPVTARPEKRP